MIRRHERADVAKIGFWSAVVALAGAVGYIVSVPLQILNLVSPLQDSIIAFASSLIIATPFLLAMLALHYLVPDEKRFWTHAAVLLAVIYTTYNTLNYVVQLATVIPAGYSWTFADQQGTVGPLSLLNQTPHSLFWDVRRARLHLPEPGYPGCGPGFRETRPSEVGPLVLPG